MGWEVDQKQAVNSGLLNEVVEILVNDMFKIGEKAIDCRPETRSIEARSKPNECVLKLPFNYANAVDVFVIAVGKSSHQFWWLKVSCPPSLRRGEHVEHFKKFG